MWVIVIDYTVCGSYEQQQVRRSSRKCFMNSSHLMDHSSNFKVERNRDS